MNSVIFFGTDDFATHILSVMVKAGVDVKAIVTKPDRPQKRKQKLLPPPVKQFIQNEGVHIPLYQPIKASTKEFAQTLRDFSPDLFVVVSYGEIISQELLDIPRLLPINIHPSLLPKYRGASPLRSAILNGDKETGIAIIEMVKAMDAGDILALEKIKIEKDDNHSSLQKKVFEKSGEILLNLLKEFEKGDVKKTPQVGDVTFTKKFSKSDQLIDFGDGCEAVLNKIKAFGDEPGAFCRVKIAGEDVVLKIIQAKRIDDNEGQIPATKCFSRSEGWELSLSGGTIKILKIQKQGKKIMSVFDFINGLRGVPPQLLSIS
ncbi:MAG: Methionyl-tRNA formyltransferase [Chlamydiia bacterium]|nr:Methionyl-tRNA formyltransferase [Chlamydiia bacterium]